MEQWVAITGFENYEDDDQGRKKTNHNKRKRVEIIENGKQFNSLTECSEYLEVSRTAICSQLNGRLLHVKGLTFRYI